MLCDVVTFRGSPSVTVKSDQSCYKTFLAGMSKCLDNRTAGRPYRYAPTCTYRGIFLRHNHLTGREGSWDTRITMAAPRTSRSRNSRFSHKKLPLGSCVVVRSTRALRAPYDKLSRGPCPTTFVGCRLIYAEHRITYFHGASSSLNGHTYSTLTNGTDNQVSRRCHMPKACPNKPRLALSVGEVSRHDIIKC